MASKEALVSLAKNVMTLFTELSLAFLEADTSAAATFALSEAQRSVVEELIVAASAHADELVRARAEDFTKLLAKMSAYTVEKHEEIPLYITKGRSYAKDIIARIAPSQSNTPRADKTATPRAAANAGDDSAHENTPGRPRSASASNTPTTSKRHGSVTVVTSPRRMPSFGASASDCAREEEAPESAQSSAVVRADDPELVELRNLVRVLEASSLPVKERRKLNLPECFAAPDFVDMMLKKKLAKTREQAVRLAMQMQSQRLIVHVHGSHVFKDDPTSYFRFAHDGEDNVSSTSSQLELDPRKTAAAQREIAELHKGAKKGVKEDDLDHGVFKKKIQAIWSTFDVNGNGTLDENEQLLFFGLVFDQIYLSAAAKKRGGAESAVPNRKETILKWMTYFDANGDGLLQWDEFKNSINLLVDINEAERLRLVDVKVSGSEAAKTPRAAESDAASKLDASNHFVKEIYKLIENCSGAAWASVNEAQRAALRQGIWAKFATYHAAALTKPDAGSAATTLATAATTHDAASPAPVSLRESRGAVGQSSAKLAAVDAKRTAKDFADLEKVSKKASNAEELEERVKALWQTFDVDGNGILDLQEQESFFGSVYDYIFKKKGSLKLRKESREETIKQWRKYFDANGDGQLSWSEFRESMKLIQDADEAEKILDRALHAPDMELTDAVISAKKCLYSESMLSLNLNSAAFRKGSQIGKIPKLELIKELVKLFEELIPSGFKSASPEALKTLKKDIGARIDRYDAAVLRESSASSERHKRVTSSGSNSGKDERGLLGASMGAGAAGNLRGLVRRVTTRKTSKMIRHAVDLGPSLSAGPVKALTELTMIYVKTLHALIDALAPASPPSEAVAELRVDLYAIANQIAHTFLKFDVLKTGAQGASESYQTLHNSVHDLISGTLDGREGELNMEKLAMGNYILHSKKKFLESAARVVPSLVASATLALSTLNQGGTSEADRVAQLMQTRGVLTTLQALNNDVAAALRVSALRAPAPKGAPRSYPPSLWDAAANPEVTDPDIDPNDGYRPGSFNQILVRLTQTPLTVGRIDSLLFGGLSFGSPDFIVSKFIERFHVPPDVYKSNPELYAKVKVTTAQLFGCFLRKELHALDATDLDVLQQFCTTIQAEESEVSADLSDILKSLSKRFAVRNFKPPAKVPVYMLPSHDPVPGAFHAFLAFDDDEIADQISRIDWALYKLIEPSEFEDQSWSKPKNAVYGKNLSAFMERVNAVSHWAATALILPEKLSMRQEVLKRLIGIAKSLRDQNNFSSLVGVLTGLNMAASQRLKFTFDMHGKLATTLKSLNQYQDPSKSFGYLRDAMAEIDGECIPFIGIFLGDLVLMDDGNPDRVTLQNVELINLPKYRMMSQTVSNVLHYKFANADGSRYEVDAVEPLASYFAQPPFLVEDELYKLSLEREPRGATAKDLQ